MSMFKCLEDVKQNDYKIQLAMKKPWYMSKMKFNRRVVNFFHDLPNWAAKWRGKYLIVDFYFDETGPEKDQKLCEVKTGYKDNVAWFHNDDSKTIITNIWI